MRKRSFKAFFSSLVIYTLSLSLTLVPTLPLSAQGIGLIPYPVDKEKGFFSTELMAPVDEGTGAGLQARYTHKFSSALSLDGGLQIGTAHIFRAFASGDYEFFPEFESQPRLSLRPFFQFGTQFHETRIQFGAGPVASKRFEIEGHALVPYLALPIGLVLNQTTSTYHVSFPLTLGAIMASPFPQLPNMLLNGEVSIDLRNGDPTLLIGASLPIL